MAGRVDLIIIAAESGAEPSTPSSVEAIEGRGLAGDRYLLGEQGGSRKGNLTLIEGSSFDHLISLDLELGEAELRRNLVVSGIELNPLVGREFSVGDVLCRATELCEPCRYIERRTKQGVLAALVGRGGIRAEILSGGTVSIGDPVVPA